MQIISSFNFLASLFMAEFRAVLQPIIDLFLKVEVREEKEEREGERERERGNIARVSDGVGCMFVCRPQHGHAAGERVREEEALVTAVEVTRSEGAVTAGT